LRDPVSSHPPLPAPIVEWLASATPSKLGTIQTRAGGGASREGALIELVDDRGHSRACYLSYDLRPDLEMHRITGFRREVSALASVGKAGLRVPSLIAFNEDLRACVTELVPGAARFDLIEEDSVRNAVAADFARELAAIHALDVRELPLSGFVRPPSVSAGLHAELLRLESEHNRGIPDPLLVFALDWLKRHVPADPGRMVLVHGDAGPANFLFEGDHLTAMLDWELTHLGDPMEDLAWICVRMLFVPFVPLPFVFEVYARAAGAAVDLTKVRFYRVYNLVTLVVDVYAQLRQGKRPFGGVLANNLMFHTSHLRALVQGLADVLQLSPRDVSLPQATATEDARFYEIALDDLRLHIVPRIGDEFAAHRTKALARLIKYWEQKARYGGAYEAAELEELTKTLGRRPADVADGRRQLVRHVLDHSLPESVLLDLFHSRMQREIALLRPAMGTLAGRQFPPLE
jgi:aminoglycoside phosphotransferase (APT) family kinase protein